MSSSNKTQSDADSMAQALEHNRANWDRVAQGNQGRTALPNYGPLCPSESELSLLGDVRGKSVIEIGCGDGQSLAYLAQMGATRLCGLDLSLEQIRNASALALDKGFSSELFCMPMEERASVEEQSFDIAISLYAIGWSVDLDTTVENIASYLKPGGSLIFSWEHPVYNCLKFNRQTLHFTRSYNHVGPNQRKSWNGDPIVLHARTVSTYLNACSNAGLFIEKVLEPPPPEETPLGNYPRRWYSRDKAKLMPTTLIVKARKAG